jgi:Fe-S-cluster containining protein
VHLLETDDDRVKLAPEGDRLLERLTILDDRPPGWRFMRNTGARCAALDLSKEGLFPCAIYAHRPDDCRIVEPGSPCCLEARQLGHLGTSVEFVREAGGA